MTTPPTTARPSAGSASSISDKFEKIKTLVGYKVAAKKPPDIKKPWKPITLRFPFLALLFLVTLAIIAALEYLHYVSREYDASGVYFGTSIDYISATATFLYLYLPTLIAVLYAMITWVDLDVRRLEPWFRISRPDGPSAKESILLHYPFDFGPYVPLKSARRKYVSQQPLSESS